MKETTFMELIDVLMLKADRKRLYKTSWGTKTIIGLKATIERIIEEEKK
uniref:Uncharacterized protein n=1 Tax=viral metagenome TaxID=1070528 RepID=A0A6M3JHE3_9ZZZZ